jgi:hypothetical protein
MRQADYPGYRQMSLARSGDRCGESGASVTWGTLRQAYKARNGELSLAIPQLPPESHQHADWVFDECLERGKQLSA